MDGLKSKHYQQRLVFFLTVLTLRAEKMVTSRSQSLNFLSGEFHLFEFSLIKCYFSYDDISIMFDNLGYGYNAVINGLSIFILKTQVNNSTNPKSDFLFM